MYIKVKHNTCTAHKITGHKGKCRFLHGHNYGFSITVSCDELDNLGMVLDFAYLKEFIKIELDRMFDHKTVIWKEDPQAEQLKSVVEELKLVDYNPTAENMAIAVFNELQKGLNYIVSENREKLKLHQVKVEETEHNVAVYNGN